MTIHITVSHIVVKLNVIAKSLESGTKTDSINIRTKTKLTQQF